ncbi:MAG: RNase adapter RapZ [Gammaproteobacteria bacterium]
MNLVIVSGLSGSGKSVALHALEDMDFYCIDNLPVTLLDAFATEIKQQSENNSANVAVGIDARNHPDQLVNFPDIIAGLKNKGIYCKILFLQADDATLLKRFSETRRKHPLSGSGIPLADAIVRERSLLTPITANADMFIDTSRTNVHQLRDLIMEFHGNSGNSKFSLLLRSFGYKHGLPTDADFVFDARCLPNPYWQPSLRALSGKDTEVSDYLDGEAIAQQYYKQLEQFLSEWIPHFKADNRSYLSIAIGCTGGQHRSVYLVEKLARQLNLPETELVKRHRELE